MTSMVTCSPKGPSRKWLGRQAATDKQQRILPLGGGRTSRANAPEVGPPDPAAMSSPASNLLRSAHDPARCPPAAQLGGCTAASKPSLELGRGQKQLKTPQARFPEKPEKPGRPPLPGDATAPVFLPGAAPFPVEPGLQPRKQNRRREGSSVHPGLSTPHRRAESRTIPGGNLVNGRRRHAAMRAYVPGNGPARFEGAGT